MSLLLDAVLRSSVLLLVGLSVAASLRRRSAALRHAVVAAAVLAAVLSVPLAIAGPSWEVSLPAMPAGAAITPENRAAQPAAGMLPDEPAESSHGRAGRAAAAVALAWAAGFLAFAGWLGAGLVRLARVDASARPVGDMRWTRDAGRVAHALGLRRHVAIVQTELPDMLATWGVFRPAVLLPAGAHRWPDARIRAVLSHELAHVRRHDWIVQMAAEALRTVFWFNPLMWIACRRLRRESEQAADDAVLRLGVAPAEYARDLLEIAKTCRRPGRWVAATGMARPSTLERRIAAMLNAHTNRTPLSRGSLVTTAVLLLALALPIAALRAGQASPRPLVGIVYDTTGAVLPGVTLTLEGAGGIASHATTGSDGRFEFPPVQPGRYGFDLRLAGFGNLRQEIVLNREQDFDRAITLQVGELTETIHVEASRVAPAAVPGPEPRRVRVGGNIKVPLKVRDVKPVYPESMRAAGRQGIVPVDAVIGVDGTVQAARVLGAHIHPDFAEAALEAVRGWLFTPTLLNGEPVEVRMTVSITFKLAD